MSAPSYESSNYDAAAKKYQDLQDKYTGEAGYALAEKQAQNSAETVAANAGSNASAEASRAARTSGMTRGAAAAMGAAQGANASANAYNSAYTNARAQSLQNNANTVNAQGNLLSSEMQKDTNKYNSDSAKWNAGMGIAGGVFNGIASALSDENKKCIKNKSHSDRCDELLAKLRG